MSEAPRSNDLLERCPIIIELPVSWGEMDAFQHVNNVAFFRYFESARIAYGDKVDMYRHLTEEGIGPILASTSCDFLKPLRYPDTIRVGCRTNRLTHSEMEQEYAIYSLRLQRIAAIGTGRIVAYDYRALKRSSFPRPLIERILQLQPEIGLE
jgi:acyl-CoA thioester hydrolase